MSELLDKLTSYRIFNYLLPGTVFATLGNVFTSYPLLIDDIFAAPFVYYFFGVVISRFGSLVIEPVSKRTKFVVFADYDSFIKASVMKNSKIEELSELNNTYRTFSALFVLLVVLMLFERSNAAWNISISTQGMVVSLILVVVFLFSYRKQTAYIVKRVIVALENKN